MTNNKVLLRVLLTAAIALAGVFGGAGVASAQADNESVCHNSGDGRTGNETNGGSSAQTDVSSGSATQDNGSNCVNEGDGEGEVDQSGSASSGDGVAGQVAGVVSAGDASVDATNRSDDVDVSTGNANGTNDANLDVRAGIGFDFFGGDKDEDVCAADGLGTTGNETNGSPQTGVESPATNQNNGGSCLNSGDADATIGQTADAASGDGVGGQVIGVVTSAGGSADLVLDNESSDADVDSGNGDFANTGEAFVDSGVFFEVLGGGGGGGGDEPQEGDFCLFLGRFPGILIDIGGGILLCVPIGIP